MSQSPFFTVHQDLPREGPGEAADVFWALNRSNLSGAVSVLDAACGPGADLVTLATALPDALITGIDRHPPFVRAAQSRVARFGPRMSVIQGEMGSPGGPYDFIWCAGAIYFLGVTEGLTTWRSAIKPDGWIAFSEPVLLDGPQPDAVAEFWEEYPQITDISGIRHRVENAGYSIEGERLIVGSPWAEYYTPMTARINALRATDPSPDLIKALDESEKEVATWASVPDHIAYVLMLVRPT